MTTNWREELEDLIYLQETADWLQIDLPYDPNDGTITATPRQDRSREPRGCPLWRFLARVRGGIATGLKKRLRGQNNTATPS